MNNAVNHLVTVSAQRRASKTHGEERSEESRAILMRQRKSIKAAVKNKRKGMPVMVEWLRQKSEQRESVHNTKLVASKHQECPEDKRQDPNSSESKNRKKEEMARNRSLLCQMPCSDRGIGIEKKGSHAQHCHRPSYEPEW